MNLALFFKALDLPNRQLLYALRTLGSLDAIYKASKEQLAQFFNDSVLKVMLHSREADQLPPSYHALEELVESMGLLLVVYGTTEYPIQLAETPEPPAIFFVHGPLNKLRQPQIAIVGSRNSTALGGRTARDFAHRLAACGFGITSGLATGIDSAAHRGALSVSQYTCAVLGTGPDIIYPKRNNRLAEQILEAGGSLVSEFLPGSPPRAAHFPQRNRIVTGLSLGVLVVEATERSGSLISARLGAEQGREVFAIPGSIHSPHSSGCHRLIREGATLVSSPEQVVEQLGPMLGFQLCEQPAHVNQEHRSRQPKEHSWLLNEMGFAPIQIDDLCDLCERDSAEVTAALAELELSGHVAQTALGYQRLN